MSMALIDIISKLGDELGFEVHREVVASEGACVDAVWFDKRLAPSTFGIKSYALLREVPVLPVVAFEVEMSTGGNAKHVKGSVSNLANLGAQLSVIVICNESVDALKKRTKAFSAHSEEEVARVLMNRVYGWVFAESRPSGRLVIMTEAQVREWAARRGICVDQREPLTLGVDVQATARSECV